MSNEEIEIRRASGKCICPQCGEQYQEHPVDFEVLSFDGQPFLTVLCSGEKVKL